MLGGTIITVSTTSEERKERLKSEALYNYKWNSCVLNVVRASPTTLYTVYRIVTKPKSFWDWLWNHERKKEWPLYQCDTKEAAMLLADHLNKEDAPRYIIKHSYEVRQDTLWTLRKDIDEMQEVLEELRIQNKF